MPHFLPRGYRLYAVYWEQLVGLVPNPRLYVYHSVLYFYTQVLYSSSLILPRTGSCAAFKASHDTSAPI